MPAAAAIPLTTVYPRVCGGTDVRVGIVNSPGGLSPRVRGNRDRNRAAVVADRSIPACAGNPPRRPVPPARAGSIPACAGEPRCTMRNRPAGRGLSPRVRGNRTEWS